MSGFRRPEQPREQMVLGERRLEETTPLDHPGWQFDSLLNSTAFATTLAEWERSYVLAEGKPPYSDAPSPLTKGSYSSPPSG